MERRSRAGQVAFVIVLTARAMKSSGPRESDSTHGTSRRSVRPEREGPCRNCVGVPERLAGVTGGIPSLSWNPTSVAAKHTR